jgi:hypothetical protein
MPDKKITQSTEHITPILGIDVLPMVANTTTTPTNYKVQVKNFLSQIVIDLPQTVFSALKITAAVTADANATQTAGEFNMLANSSMSAAGLNRYGLVSTNKIQNGNTVISGQIAAALFVLDTGNSNTIAANTFGIMINHALDANVAAARKIQPRAYVAILEDAGSNVAAQTKYLMDIGALGKPVSADAANTNVNVVFSKTADKIATHTVKVCINGQDVWLLASNTAPA